MPLTTCNTSAVAAAATVSGDSCGVGANGEDTLTDQGYYKSWHRNLTSNDDVTSGFMAATGVCYYDDVDRRHCVEHIYESPMFDRRYMS